MTPRTMRAFDRVAAADERRDGSTLPEARVTGATLRFNDSMIVRLYDSARVGAT